MFANVKRERERDWCRHVKINIASADRQVERERERLVQAHQSKHCIGGSTSRERERERERLVQAHQSNHCNGESTSRERDWCRHIKVNIASADRQVERERERERERCLCVFFLNFVRGFFFTLGTRLRISNFCVDLCKKNLIVRHV